MDPEEAPDADKKLAPSPSAPIENAPNSSTVGPFAATFGFFRERFQAYFQRDLHVKEHKKILRIELVLFLCSIFSIILLCGAILKFFSDAPFEPYFWLYCVALVLYYIFSISLVVVWAVSKELTFAKLVRRIRFWVQITFLLVSLIGLLLMLKFILPESFSPTNDVRLIQLRSVTTDTAKIFMRIPQGCSDAKVYYRAPPSQVYLFSENSTTNCSAESDYTNIVRLTGLAPATLYEIMVNVSDNTVSKQMQFKTSPARGTPSKFSFYFGSCFLVLDPALFKHDNADAFSFLADVLKPDLFLFLGDFVYADVPFLPSDSQAYYYSLWRRALKNEQVDKLLSTIVNMGQSDDHEAVNDHNPSLTSNLYKVTFGFVERAITNGWGRYMGDGNPDTIEENTGGGNATHYTFNYGDSDFFMLDTRLARSNGSILGHVQLAHFYEWLSTPVNGFKFVLSPVGVTNDYDAGVADSWGGHLEERNAILDFIDANENVSRIIFLTGDMHFAYVNELRGRIPRPATPAGRASKKIYEISASPIGAFDFTIGGTFSGVTFKPNLEDREDNVLFETKGSGNMPSLIGIVRVDTTLPVPEVAIDLYDHKDLVYTLQLNATELM